MRCTIYAREKDMRYRRLLMLLALVWGAVVPVQAQRTFMPGDVFVGNAGGLINWYDEDGNLITQLDARISDSIVTGMAFDSDDNLYATTFNGGTVVKFDSAGNYIGTFGRGYSGSPESIVFDEMGNVYVGAVDGDNDVRKFDPEGNPIAQYDVATDDRGSDWIDLGPDQCTLYYTSEGRRLMRYDVCNDQQLDDVMRLPDRAYALRVLPNGEFLIAISSRVVYIDSNGDELQSYDAGRNNEWFGINRAPDGTSFWSGDLESGSIYRFDIANGDVITGPIEACLNPTNLGCVGGVAVFGELTEARSQPAVEVTQVDQLVTDADNSGEVSDGDTLAYRVILTNPIEEAITGVTFTETLDPQTALIADSISTSMGTASANGNTVTVNIGEIAAAATVEIAFEAQVMLDDPSANLSRLDNQGTVSADGMNDTPTDDPDTRSANDTTETVVFGPLPPTAVPSFAAYTPKLDVGVRAVADGPIEAGAALNWSVRLINEGNGVGENITVTIELPEAINAEQADSDVGSARTRGDTIVWQVGDLGANTVAQLDVTATLDSVPQDGRITSVVTVSGDDARLGTVEYAVSGGLSLP